MRRRSEHHLSTRWLAGLGFAAARAEDGDCRRPAGTELRTLAVERAAAEGDLAVTQGIGAGFAFDIDVGRRL